MHYFNIFIIYNEQKTIENITKSDNIRNDPPYVNQMLQRYTPLVITPTVRPSTTGKRAYPYPPDMNPTKRKPTGGKYKTRRKYKRKY
jgi:hypothetical protein